MWSREGRGEPGARVRTYGVDCWDGDLVVGHLVRCCIQIVWLPFIYARRASHHTHVTEENFLNCKGQSEAEPPQKKPPPPPRPKGKKHADRSGRRTRYSLDPISLSAPLPSRPARPWTAEPWKGKPKRRTRAQPRTRNDEHPHTSLDRWHWRMLTAVRIHILPKHTLDAGSLPEAPSLPLHSRPPLPSEIQR